MNQKRFVLENVLNKRRRKKHRTVNNKNIMYFLLSMTFAAQIKTIDFIIHSVKNNNNNNNNIRRSNNHYE